MSSSPDFGGMLPKAFKKKSFGVNEKLGIQKLFRMIFLGPTRDPDQELYDYIKEKLQGFVTFYDPDAPPSVDAIKEIPNALQLFIIDNYSNDKKLQKMIRLNSEYIAILKANSKRDLQLILKDFNLPGVREDDIYRYYKQATAQKGQILFIDSVKQQIRKNFKGEIYN
ncbi:uncharacterized protein PITG_19136 [Phytophthora infestans T30-4]|uniref:Uncharacterized protein n=1 Tax=Phytophthora infestans (strain T30-4) TaxID=403677 RepID=D0NYX3_PHYIT|nr:uncharacterized protein PITG_19136 [Phytophthora infestans T30-4]EEY68756.1 conserved hypothetical protein [Phytophthora infestans T30-4]|eukprot:XP_002997448.1 conserved hypothetical protein [Phytophthora infestans T30-4]